MSSDIKEKDNEWESSFDFHELKKEAYYGGMKILKLLKAKPINPEIKH